MRILVPVLALAATIASPAHADVVAQSEAGFAASGSSTVTATPEQAWRLLVVPARWWNKAHTWSGDAANLSIDPRPGGCYCETLPAAKGRVRGGVEHMRVVMVRPGRMLRMKGALGPLQGEAVQGTLTVNLEPATGGTRIEWTYVVGGYMRMKTEQIAPAVNRVLSEQFASLSAQLGLYRPG